MGLEGPEFAWWFSREQLDWPSATTHSVMVRGTSRGMVLAEVAYTTERRRRIERTISRRRRRRKRKRRPRRKRTSQSGTAKVAKVSRETPPNNSWFRKKLWTLSFSLPSPATAEAGRPLGYHLKNEFAQWDLVCNVSKWHKCCCWCCFLLQLFQLRHSRVHALPPFFQRTQT